MRFIFPGLKEQEVTNSRLQYGSNAVTTFDQETFWDKLWGNFKDPIIIILVFALAITVILTFLGYTEWYESVGIAVAVFIATFVATWSEYSNETEFQKLLEEASMIQVKVFRNNHLIEININDLVVDDYILLQPGDTIPTDGIVVAGHLDVNEASMTGESEAVRKIAILKKDQISKENNVYKETLIEDGEAVMKATAVGDKTRYGETMKEIVKAENRLSPLQEKLTVLGKHISTFGYIGAIFIFVAFMLNHIFLQTDGGLSSYLAQPSGIIISHVITALTLAIIIIVVAVPEGLPMMIAMVLALNMRKLLSVKVLVRKLLGIETAGSLTVLFTDKTGTLTQGKLAVEEFLTGNSDTYQKLEEIPAPLRNMLAFSVRNNTSAVIDTRNLEKPNIVGADRTEQAMLRFLTPLLEQKADINIVDKISFNSLRKFSATQVEGEQALTLVKGAAEIILEQCTHYLDANGHKIALTDKDALKTQITTLSTRAMRLLVVAITETPLNNTQELPHDLTLVGMFGMRDALRTEAYASVKIAKDAGVHVIMITGDAKGTAEAIGRDVGLLSDDHKAQVITSTTLAQMSDEELKKQLPHIYVVARAFPIDKTRLIKVAKSLGWVVGMTGDGVNDAPAVKNADVGFSMGSGTEMTKES
ncbi:MAG: HAD family hydrolase, partial [Thiomargarita sp.]|nr:HAD family hydrolase [Thiomargarita sp.]